MIQDLKNWLIERTYWLRTGQTMKIANAGHPVDEIVIRYEDYYFSIMLDAESGEPTGDFYWSADPLMSHVLVRERYVAKKERA